MRRCSPLLLLAALVAISCPFPNEDEEDQQAEWPPPEQVGPDERPARVIVPETYDGWESHRVVLLLGGYDYFSADLDDWLGVRDHLEAHPLRSAVLVLADGLVDSTGSPFWNATDTCCDFDGTGVDDVAYLLALVREVHDRFATDGELGVVGHSAGGFMGYRLACEPDSPVTSLVSIAGSSWLDPDDCGATHSIALLQVHGTHDDVMPIDGDQDAPGADELLRRWGERANCDLDSWTEAAPQEYLDDGVDAETAVGGYSEDCWRSVGLWEMEGADHYPAFNDAFAAEIVRFSAASRR